MFKLLIIGVDGFVGSYLKQEFEKEYSVFGIGIKELGYDNYFKCDISNKKELISILYKVKPDFIINLAAILSTSNNYHEYDKSYNVNVKGLSNIFESVVETKTPIKHFISFSSAEVYGEMSNNSKEDDVLRPSTIYSLTKSMSENLCHFYSKVYDIPITITRPSVIYGEGQTGRFFIPNLIKSMVNNEQFDTTYGEQTRDFIHIHDIFLACTKILANNLFINEIVNLSHGKSYKIKEVITIVKEITNSLSIINFGALPYRANEIMKYSISNGKIKKVINDFPTIDLATGLSRCFNSMKS